MVIGFLQFEWKTPKLWWKDPILPIEGCAIDLFPFVLMCGFLTLAAVGMVFLKRRQVAEELGATLSLDPTVCDAGLEIKRATDRRGADVVVEYSGARQAVQQALRGVAYGGTIVLGAFPPPYGAGLDFGAEAHLNIPNVVFTRACSQPDRDHPRWDNERICAVCWRLLCEGALTGEPIVQPVVPFDDLLVEYSRIASDPGSNIKLGVRFS